MLRSLHADADAQAHLTTFMELTSLGQLYNTCTLWRRWLILPQQSGHRHAKRSINYTTDSLPLMLRCNWLLQTVTEITTELKHPPLVPLSDPEKWTSQQLFVRFLLMLPRFQRLDSLHIRFEEYQLPPPRQLHDLLLPFAGRLRSLTVSPFNSGCLNAIKAFCGHLPLFVQLESLRLRADLSSHSSFDLSALPGLRHLHTFSCEHYNDRVSVDQAAIFASCRALTSLSFGAWGPCRAGDADNADALTVFVDSRFPKEDLDPSSSFSALTPVASLTDFPFMTPLTVACWAQLSRLTTLESLYLGMCELGITKDAWARLGLFTQLRTLRIGSPNPIYDEFLAASPALTTDHVWPPILQLSALTELRLSRFNLHPHHIAALPRLQSLGLVVCQQCYFVSEDLEFVSAATSTTRWIWLVMSSYGAERTHVDNRMFPLAP